MIAIDPLSNNLSDLHDQEENDHFVKAKYYLFPCHLIFILHENWWSAIGNIWMILIFIFI